MGSTWPRGDGPWQNLTSYFNTISELREQQKISEVTHNQKSFLVTYCEDLRNAN